MSSKLSELHHLCLKLEHESLQQRLHSLASFLLDVKYGPWLDGTTLESLDDFNYQLDLLDCVTYVEVVLALAKTTPDPDYVMFVKSFEQNLRKLHYANGTPNFLSRNHFFCIDWIVNNKHVALDVTKSLSLQYKFATTIIDRPSWASHHSVNKTNSEPLPQHIIEQIPKQESIIPYIETAYILDNYDNFMESLPECCIINIVRPNWDLRDAIGTYLNISHLGFVFKKPISKELDFFHSTIVKMETVKENLKIYLQRYLNSPTIRGINILTVT